MILKVIHLAVVLQLPYPKVGIQDIPTPWWHEMILFPSNIAYGIVDLLLEELMTRERQGVCTIMAFAGPSFEAYISENAPQVENQNDSRGLLQSKRGNYCGSIISSHDPPKKREKNANNETCRMGRQKIGAGIAFYFSPVLDSLLTVSSFFVSALPLSICVPWHD